MEILRTPEERWHDLPDFSWEPRYAEVGSEAPAIRMAYLDEGPASARPILLLHGEPSWSFLYRSAIGPLVAAGLRVVVPDLIGFGRSDKPTRREDYTYARHVEWLGDLVVRRLDLREAILVCQDWGGLLGLRLVAEHEERFAGVVASNTGLPTGDQSLGEGFAQWRNFSQQAPDFAVGRIVDAAA